MKKINIAELLRDCPQGMELDCTINDNVKFIKITSSSTYPIMLRTKNGYEINLTKYGQVHNIDDSKCVIFPKGKTTWEEFVPPCKFKDGDIIYNPGIKAVAIFCKQTDISTISHCFLNKQKELKIRHYHSKFLSDWMLATEEEKAKLFQAIKDDGYRWNEETKTLETLPKFKDGYVITCTNSVCTFTSIFKDKPTEKSFRHYCSVILDDNKFIPGIECADYANPRFATEEEKEKLFKAIRENGYRWNFQANKLEKLIKPIFKKGDKVRIKKGFPEPRIARIIEDVCDTFYTLVSLGKIDFTEQDNWELVPNKFDINTLIPFESRVLVRNAEEEIWKPAIFGCYVNKKYPYYVLGGTCWKYCIPYESNTHLRGATNDCDEYFKNL